MYGGAPLVHARLAKVEATVSGLAANRLVCITERKTLKIALALREAVLIKFTHFLEFMGR